MGKDCKLMNFSNSTTDKTEKLKGNKSLESQWESIDWIQVQKYINRLQTRIAKATVKGNRNKTKRLQYLLNHSFYAKCHAVKKVTSNKGKRTSGVDRKLWSTSASKMKAVLSLTDMFHVEVISFIAVTCFPGNHYYRYRAFIVYIYISATLSMQLYIK
ncbi:reverse transcriptase N-terminal domain-containing protein [Clostridium sp. MT-14]|uniref:reverse transcriptase N-terminal domain-containing protein n=1 Tax=Clostridium sp. MT-14 TaxID=3348360 RepID=UPI0035F3EB87